MAWIESHEDLLSHPKLKRLKRRLNVSEHEAVGLLHYFWHWAVRFAEDGCITEFTAEDIADAIRFDGDAELLLKSLIDSGFVDEEDGELHIHDWFNYAGKLIIWRRKEAERLKRYRSKQNSTGDVQESNSERTPYEHSTDTVRTPEYSNSNSKSKSNKKEKDKNTRHTKSYDEEDIHFKISEYMVEQIRQMNPNFKQPDMQKWSDEIRLMIERDGRDLELIREVMRFMYTKDTFWKTVTLSPSKLRKNFDSINSKRLSSTSISTGNKKYSKDEKNKSLLQQEMMEVLNDQGGNIEDFGGYLYGLSNGRTDQGTN